MSAYPRIHESHLGKVRGRSQYVPHDAAVAAGAFVCPRADGYGAREGVIPPGIAAEHGLIPHGLTEVTNDAALRSGRMDDDNPVTAQEQYRAYYARGAEQHEVQAPAAEAAADEEAPVRPKLPPKAPTAAPAAPARTPKVPPKVQVKRAERAKTVKKQAKRVFSAPRAAQPEDDTLEGFYAGLGRPDRGSLDPDSNWPDAPSEGDSAAPGEGGAGVAPPALPRARGVPPPVPQVQDRLVQELRDAFEAELAEERKLASDWYEEAERLREECEGLRKELGSASGGGHADGPVRVVLGEEDVRLKVAGRGWDCNVMGHLCYSRERSEVALVVTDAGYGSDLLGSVQEGECVIVSSEGRTACAYRGHCDKIYGDRGSPDFITVLRFECEPSRALA